MDLVSSTLDKYLKFRFNGTASEPNIPSNPLPENSSNTEEKVGQQPDSVASDICEPILIHTLSFQNIVPCCLAIRKSLRHIAAGFENSQIYLWAVKCRDDKELQLSEVSRLTAHSGSIYSIEFVQENDLMLSCSEDTTIRLWCIKSKCNLVVYRGHNYPIWSIAVSPRGDYFASASMDTTARLWSLDKMCPIRIFCSHEDDVECVKFHPNAKYIATGSSDTTVRLWTISDGRMVRLMVGHQGAITSLSFFPDGKYLASSSKDSSIKVWNLATNTVTNDLTVPALQTVSFSPSQEFASTCGEDNIFRIWHVDQSRITQKKAHALDDKFTKLFTSHFITDNTMFIVGLARQIAPESPTETDDSPPTTKLKTH